MPGGKLDKASYGPDWPYLQGAQPPRLHCEMIMYGVTPADTGYIRVYPGWADHDGNSVLVNGKPVNGLISLGGTVPDDDSVRTFDGLGGHLLAPDGSYVRISGVLVLDCGHYQGDIGPRKAAPATTIPPRRAGIGRTMSRFTRV